MTIDPPTESAMPREEDAVRALAVLAWMLADEPRAERLLGLTGLTPEALRARAGDGDVLAAVMRVLMGHEGDLLACADALGIAPALLAATAHRLEGSPA